MTEHRCPRCSSLAVVHDSEPQSEEAPPCEVARCLACGWTREIERAPKYPDRPMPPLRADAGMKRGLRRVNPEAVRLRRWRATGCPEVGA